MNTATTTKATLPTTNQIERARQIILRSGLGFAERGVKQGMLRIMRDNGFATVDELVENCPVNCDPSVARPWAEEMVALVAQQPDVNPYAHA